MKRFLTFSILALAASGAAAQIYSNGVQAMGATGNIIYNVSPLPPIMRGDQVIYPSGTAAVSTNGQPTACNGPLTIDRSSGRVEITCHTPAMQDNAAAAANARAADFAELATAAGGPRGMTDRNLGSDSTSGLRSDSAPAVQYTANDAASLANLAPAAGGGPRSDGNLSSDSNGLRSDAASLR